MAQIVTGRRKEAIVRIRLVPGTGAFNLNGRSLDEYFPTRAHRMVVGAPLRLVGRDKDLDVVATIEGGGVSGQAGALRLGIKNFEFTTFDHYTDTRGFTSKLGGQTTRSSVLMFRPLARKDGP